MIKAPFYFNWGEKKNRRKNFQEKKSQFKRGSDFLLLQKTKKNINSTPFPTSVPKIFVKKERKLPDLKILFKKRHQDVPKKIFFERGGRKKKNSR